MHKFSALVVNLAQAEQRIEQYKLGVNNLKRYFKRQEVGLKEMRKSRRIHCQQGLTTKYLDKAQREAASTLQDTMNRYLVLKAKLNQDISLAYDINLLFKKAGVEKCVSES